MITDAQMYDHLTGFLARVGVSTDALRAEVGEAFGEPLLVVASGSVLHGFGNAASDVDLHVIVDEPKVTDFPVSSHQLGVAVDTTYFDGGWVRAESALVTDGGHAPAGADRTAWRSARTRLLRLGRLAFGYPLAGTDVWRVWQRDLRAPFAAYAEQWWRAETLRYLTAARLLAARRPLAAALRYCDAATAALDAVATAAGETYVGHKWLGLKLARLDRPALTDAYAALLDLPTTAAEVSAYGRRVEALVADLTADRPLPADPFVRLTPGDGAGAWQVQDRVLVHRWGLRGVELGTGDAGADPKLDWTGRVSELPVDLRLLIEEDLVWMSVSGDRP